MNRPAKPWRWAPLLAVGAVVLTVLPGAAAPPGPSAPQAPVVPTVAAAVPLPAACKPNPNPPPTEYGFVARVTGGTVAGDGPLEISDIDVSVCGVVRVVAAQAGSGCEGIQARLVIPADGVVTHGLEASLVIPGMPRMEDVPTRVVASPMASDVACNDEDGLAMDLDLRISGSAGIFGLQCEVPFTGAVRATVTGPLLTPPYEGQTRVKGAVRVGAVSNNDKFCPGRLPRRLNRIAELPATGYQVDWPAKVSIYHPSAG